PHIYTLSLHDALPIWSRELEDLPRDDQSLDLGRPLADLGELGIAEDPLDGELGDVARAAVDLHGLARGLHRGLGGEELRHRRRIDRKSTRLNSSHVAI